MGSERTGNPKLFQIKGIRDGLLVQLDAEAEWKTLVKQLVTAIDRQGDFFKGARLALDVGERPLRKHELGSLQTMLEQRGVTLWAVLGKSMTTLSTTRRLDLQTSLETPAPASAPGGEAEARHSDVPDTLLRTEEDDMPAYDPEVEGTSGVLVRRTLRSGRTIRSEGHVVVLGDVNPGAKIIATGDVIVWGRLRGTVHAGALGDEEAIICALDMMPMQLRVAGHIAT
ncbi:MAG: septum site-determining protein MinC, partial [Anaerolineae bacterium]|nr:septum site-determining protein MinC [Anaerolineae bacterium]